MQPDKSKITIDDNRIKIINLLNDLVLSPRVQALKWAQITKQTPNMKIGYPGQHLASLVTGMPGTRTGARGHDLLDGSETKSCSRVDQVDKCRDCEAKVMRLEFECPECGSQNIKRNDDSKWLFTIRSTDDLKLLTKEVPRIVLALADYPNFACEDFETISFKIYEIWPKHARHSCFNELMTAYYDSIFLGHRAKNAAKTPAPKNFWPYSYQFYKCNPVLIFSAIVKNSNILPEIDIDTFVEPDVNRQSLTPVPMPTQLLTVEELVYVINAGDDVNLAKCIAPNTSLEKLRSFMSTGRATKAKFKELYEMIPFLNEALREPLSLRDTNKPLEIAKRHTRA